MSNEPMTDLTTLTDADCDMVAGARSERITTLALGEEDGGRMTTMAVGEEDGGIIQFPALDAKLHR